MPAAAKTKVKKEKEIRERSRKLRHLETYSTNSTMPVKALQDIIEFLVPLYGSKSAQSKFNLVKKVKDKLVSFENEYESSWNALQSK